MTNIRFYSSDHGMGHAARDAAIIKELTKIPGVRIFSRNLSGHNLLTKSFIKNVAVTPKQNDFGVLNEINGMATDLNRTYFKLKEWMAGWDDFIIDEKRFCKSHQIDIIVSDIAPQPFIVAKELGLPSVAVTNFTWHCIYSQLFPKEHQILKELKDAYMLAGKALILPFEQKELPFRNMIKIGLVCREKTESRENIRKKLGLNENDFAIFVSMGLSMENMPKIKIKNLPKNMKIVSNVLENSIRIPDSTYNVQDIIAAMDLVVAKAGYTTVAESISAKVPMILTYRTGFVDDNAVCSVVEKLGVGKIVSNDAFFSMECLNDCVEFSKRAKKAYAKLPQRFSTLYNEEAAKIILSC